MSKWVEAIPCKSNDHRVVLIFLKESVFSRFGVPKSIISDGGTHFCNKPFETLLAKYGVKHKVATPYHPQTSGQVELSNREIKTILMKVVNSNRKDCPSSCWTHYGHIGRLSRLFLGCPLILWCFAKHATSRWKLNTRHGGQLKSSTWIWGKPASKGFLTSMSWKNSGMMPTLIQELRKKSLRNGMTR